MSRKHFKALAAIIATIDDVAERNRMMILVGEVCDNLNKNFDWAAWNNACLK